jgi:phosphoglycolate phosphatase
MLIFWDIDGVILHCGAAGTEALINTFYKLYGIEDAFSGMLIGRAMDRTLLNRVFEKYAIPETDLPKIEKEYVEQLKSILAGIDDLTALPGVRVLLDVCELKGEIAGQARNDKGVHSLITSNLFVGARTKLESVGLWTRVDGTHYFTGGGFGDYPEEKWDTAERARKELEDLLERNIPPHEVVLIGDSVYDIQTARACGYRVISVCTGFTPAEMLREANPDAIFKDLSETERIIRKIEEFSV